MFFFFFFWFVVRTLKIYPLGKFWVCHTALLTIAIMLYIVYLISSTYSSCITETLYLLSNIFPFPSLLPMATTILLLILESLICYITHLNDIMQHLFFCIWFISLSIMSSMILNLKKSCKKTPLWPSSDSLIVYICILSHLLYQSLLSYALSTYLPPPHTHPSVCINQNTGNLALIWHYLNISSYSGLVSFCTISFISIPFIASPRSNPKPSLHLFVMSP